MRRFCVLALLAGSLLFVGLAIADDSSKKAPADPEVTSAAPSCAEEETLEAFTPAETAFDSVIGGDSQLLVCLPEDPEYCESNADCSPGNVCRLFCCV